MVGMCTCCCSIPLQGNLAGQFANIHQAQVAVSLTSLIAVLFVVVACLQFKLR